MMYSTIGTKHNSNAPKINNTKSKLVSLGVYGLALLAIGTCLMIFTREVHAQSVYSVCQESRISNNIKEGTCADMQVKYKWEYLCEVNNNNPTTHCWVERNEQLND